MASRVAAFVRMSDGVRNIGARNSPVISRSSAAWQVD